MPHTEIQKALANTRGLKSSRIQGSLLPGNRQPDAAVAVVVVPDVDAQTLGIKVADEDAATFRAETRRPNVDARKQVGVADGLVDRHAPRDFGDAGRHLIIRQQSLLFFPFLRGRPRNRLLAKHDPASFDLVDLCELLVGIPAAFLQVEVVLVEATNLEDRHGTVGSGDEHVAVVAAPLEHLHGW